MDGTNIKIRSLSNSVFEGRTSTGSRLFASLGSASNTNLLASRHMKRESASLPVDVRRLKTSLLKLPNVPRGGPDSSFLQ